MTGINVTRRTGLTILLACAGWVLHGPALAASDLEGRWWGGIEVPGDFSTAILTLGRDGELWVGSVARPNVGISSSAFEVVSTEPRVVLRVPTTEKDEVIVLEGSVGEDGLFQGQATLRGRSVPFVFRRVVEPTPEALDLYLGDYAAPDGERLRIDRAPGPLEALVLTRTFVARQHALFSVAPGEFVAGPDLERPAPAVARLRFDHEDHGRIVLLLTGPDGVEQRCRRMPIAIDEKRIAQYVEEQLLASGAPSFSVGIVHGDDLVYAGSFGVKNRESQEPATPDTLYQVASVTKLFTATLLAIMRDEGIVALDDPVTRYLPADVRMPATGATGDPAITLRHLVTHTSGLRLQPTNYVFEGRHNNHYTVEGLYECMGEIGLIFPAGRSWSYSNLGYVLLGHALARAGGDSYETLLKDKILGPLGMDDSTVNFDDADLARLATHYWSDDPKTSTPPWLPGEIAAQGGLSSTVRDMAKFLSMCLRTERADGGPLRGSTLHEMQRPQVQRLDSGGRMGHAWFLDDIGEAGRVLYHSGFTGGHSSYLAVSPGHGTGVVVLTNFGFQPAVRVGQWMIDEAVQAARAQHPATPRQAAQFYAEGDWTNAAWAYGTLMEIDPNKLTWRERHERAEAMRSRAR